MQKSIKPAFKHVIWSNNSCLNVKTDRGNHLSNAWHYHPEIELILVKGSTGTRIVGTSMETFGDNDLILIGKNLPHAFLHDEKNEENLQGEALVIQFSEHFLGTDFLGLPDFKEIFILLEKAKNGLSVNDSAKAGIVAKMENMQQASALQRIILLLEILHDLTAATACRTLVVDDLLQQMGKNDTRINQVVEFTYANFDEHIKIENVAKIANLTKESFCRYFKTHTNKTYMEFLTEFRINKACAMIRENQKSIKEIGYACGFDSLSNFYYQFKKIVKLSPLDYKSQIM